MDTNLIAMRDHLDHRSIMRPYSRIERRPPGWRPDPRMGAVNEVMEEFPDYDIDQVQAELQRRGTRLSRGFVKAVMHAAGKAPLLEGGDG